MGAAGLEGSSARMRSSQAEGILPDVFQELLIADLVVADLTIDNPNVYFRQVRRATYPWSGAHLQRAGNDGVRSPAG